MLFTFPSRYWFAIGLLIVFSLGGWCRRFQTGFLRSRPTQGNRPTRILARTGLSPCIAGLPMPFRFVSFAVMRALQPRTPLKAPGLGCAPFARLYLGYHCCFLFLRVLRCFSSPRLPPQFVGITYLYMMGCPIRKSADRWPFAPPRGLSQLVTSFFAVKSQGIPCAPFVTYSISTRCFSSLAPLSRGATFVFFVLLFSFQPVKELLRRVSRRCVEDNGFEPMTPCVQSRCSSQLSQSPADVVPGGLEPPTPTLSV